MIRLLAEPDQLTPSDVDEVTVHLGLVAAVIQYLFATRFRAPLLDCAANALPALSYVPRGSVEFQNSRQIFRKRRA